MDFARQVQDTIQSAQVAQLNAYYEGMKEGVRMFARWKDGTCYVGSCGKTLNEALAIIDGQRTDRLERLWRGMGQDSNLSHP